MKKILLLVCFIGSMLTIGSCSSDDNSDSQPTSKEALEKKLQGQWERYKITNVHTKEEIDQNEYHYDSFNILEFKLLNYLSFKWDWQYDRHQFEGGHYKILTEKELLITPSDSRYDPITYTVLELSKNELILHLNNNRLEAQEHFKRVK